jgi:hypothetical protein
VTAVPGPALQPAFRCSARSLELGEPLDGTASTVRNWLLVEQPGPWGYRALSENRLAADVAARLRRVRDDLGVRVVLIRRADRPLLPGGPAGRHLFAIHSGPERSWVEHLLIDSPADLLGLDLEPLGRGMEPRIGEAWTGPLFLVCTNGRRDPCCAERGRPVAAALAATAPERAWECSHIGGDRFAATLVAFPHGLYFGRVGALGPAVADAYVRGRIALANYRGRSSEPFPAQAAEIHLRRSHELHGVDDLRWTELVDRDDGAFVAGFDTADGRRLRAVVRVSPAEPARPFTCRSDEPATPPAYTVRELDEVSPG